MSTSDGSADPRASCGACERDDALSAHENRAGLEAIDYRVAAYGRFLRRMSGWIGRQKVPPNEPAAPRHPLAGLTVRDADDPALALMDAWACALDVLTFYQERIANEGFLRTATERRSVLELARAIGYELGPGVAASTRLAFTLLDTDKAPDEVPLAVGLQVQSVPGPGELPQTFETVEAVVARPEWNAMALAQREEHPLNLGETVLYLEGLSTGLRGGDALLVVGDERLADVSSGVWEFRTVLDAKRIDAHGITEVRLSEGLGWQSPDGAFTVGPPAVPRVYAFSRRLHVFGHSAPDPRLFQTEYQAQLASMLNGDRDAWLGFNVSDDGAVHVVGEQAEIVPGSWVVLQDVNDVELYGVTDASVSARSDFGLSLKTTRLSLDTDVGLGQFEPRSVSVHAVSRELTPTTRPIDRAVQGSELVLERQRPLHEPGRAVFVSGPPHGSADDAEHQVEVAIVRAALEESRYGALRTVLQLESPLEGSYDRSRTRVLGNVARATHGKTVPIEVLGSGDGSQTFQSFALRQAPLSYVSTSSGNQSTLTVRVGGVAWKAAGSPYGLGPDDRVYVPRVDDEGTTRIHFGDGVNGTRLPTGSENVTASYRQGLGSAGAVDEATLSILKTRPKGVTAVTNPERAVGAEDPEALADARVNAPVTVLTLDRLVSVSDYEDYARAYPGIGKAQSVRLWDGRRWWVHLTLATSEGAALAPTDDLYQSLVADIHARRDPVQQVWIDTYQPRSFKLRGSVVVDPAHVAEDVLEAVAAELRGAFSFEQRSFGQPATGAEVLAACHRVVGVVAVDLDTLFRDDDVVPAPSTTSPASWVLPAYGARWDGGVRRAELLQLDTALDAVDLAESVS